MQNDLDRIRAIYGKAPPKKPKKQIPITNSTKLKSLEFTEKESDKLMTFQSKGVEMIEKFNGCALLADDPGLGKTAQYLSWLRRRPDVRPAIIVCPAFLKINWSRECEKWMLKEKVTILSGKYKPGMRIPKSSIYIINYDILSNEYIEKVDLQYGKVKKVEVEGTGWVDHLIALNAKSIAVDECHSIKHEGPGKTKATLKLLSKIESRVGISATPFENKPIELFNILKAIRPDMFPNKFIFGKRYCNGKKNNFGWEFKGATNKEELHRILVSNVMIRRKKEDVLKELPNKSRHIVSLPLTNKITYQQAEYDFISWLKSQKASKEKITKALGAKALTRITALDKITQIGKMKSALEWIANFLESEEKLVVFAKNTAVIDKVMQAFQKIAVKIDGSMSASQKQKSCDDFQNNSKVRVLVGNIDAAGVGWTFTASSNVCFLQYPWSPSKLIQCEDRCHRIGQTAESINCWYLVSNTDLEINRIFMLHDKQKIYDSIIDGKKESGFGDTMMDKVFDQEEIDTTNDFLEKFLI